MEHCRNFIKRVDNIIINGTLENGEKVTIDFTFKDGVISRDEATLTFDYAHHTATLKFDWTSFELKIL